MYVVKGMDKDKGSFVHPWWTDRLGWTKFCLGEARSLRQISTSPEPQAEYSVWSDLDPIRITYGHFPLHWKRLARLPIPSR